jgi:hypothetical protein
VFCLLQEVSGSFVVFCLLQEISGSFRLLSQNAGRTQNMAADSQGGSAAKHPVLARQSDSSVEEIFSVDTSDVAPTPGGYSVMTALASHWAVLWATWIQCTHILTSFHPCLGPTGVLFPCGLPSKTLCTFPCDIFCSSHTLLFGCPIDSTNYDAPVYAFDSSVLCRHTRYAMTSCVHQQDINENLSSNDSAVYLRYEWLEHTAACSCHSFRAINLATILLFVLLLFVILFCSLTMTPFVTLCFAFFTATMERRKKRIEITGQCTRCSLVQWLFRWACCLHIKVVVDGW